MLALPVVVLAASQRKSFLRRWDAARYAPLAGLAWPGGAAAARPKSLRVALLATRAAENLERKVAKPLTARAASATAAADAWLCGGPVGSPPRSTAQPRPTFALRLALSRLAGPRAIASTSPEGAVRPRAVCQCGQAIEPDKQGDETGSIGEPAEWQGSRDGQPQSHPEVEIFGK